jgi:hypothetical protein
MIAMTLVVSVRAWCGGGGDPPAAFVTLAGVFVQTDQRKRAAAAIELVSAERDVWPVKPKQAHSSSSASGFFCVCVVCELR